MYAVVVEIKQSITNPIVPDIRWTFFQDPFIVEDALGRKFPVPSEYDISLLNAIIKHKFEKGPGAREVAAGYYEIVDARNRLHNLSKKSCPKPGSLLIMAIIVRKPDKCADHSCPIPQCGSENTIEVLGGGRLW